MKLNINKVLGAFVIAISTISCTSNDVKSGDGHSHEGHHHDEEDEVIRFTVKQFDALEMKVGTIESRFMGESVQVTGKLEVPPQNEATVTAIIGANVASIEVIEGDDIEKGQVLAYLSHPNLTKLQSDFLESYTKKNFLETDFDRQKKLFEADVISGKVYQQTQAEYLAAKALYNSYKSQLEQLGLNAAKVQQGDFYNKVPVKSPISGSVTAVEVKLGQYVDADKDLFEIVNVDHIHADFMVFEKDIHKVKKGQVVRFTAQASNSKEYSAKIYSVGKKFEEYPKAVHLHADIEAKDETLIPGMYLTGEILTDSTKTLAMPEDAITRDGESTWIFMANKEINMKEDSWSFTPIRVKTEYVSNGMVSIVLLDKVSKTAQYALNNAYYLLAELKKGEAEHSH